MRKPLAMLGILGFLISVTVHITTFFGIDLSQTISGILVMHVCIFPLFFAMIFFINIDNKTLGLGSQIDIKYFSRLIPRPMLMMIVLFFIYAFINFMLFFFLSEGGTPEIRDGQYFLANRGTVIRVLTESEYQWQKAYMLRGFSGHWMIFYLVPAIYLWFSGDQSSEVDAGFK